MKKFFAALATAAIFISIPTVAFATPPALPSTTTWTNAGLQEMVRFSGPLSVSIDGAGFSQTGSIQVEKPANSTVIAAYLTSALTTSSTSVPGVTLEGQSVVFTHKASQSSGSSFVNHFADVTSIVKPIIDNAAAGISSLALTESAGDSGINDGEELVVIFDDPAKPASSVILMFGASRTSGDSFAFNFPAISDLNAQIPTLSVGIGFSYQSSGNRSQQSDIKLSTTTVPTLQAISLTAGGQEDGAGTNGALVTVGGIGDSTSLPGLTSNDDDDELYGLSSYLSVGDTNLTINTRNASGNDNLFQAVLYFEGVTVAGATAVGSAPVVFVGNPPVSSPQVSPASPASPAAPEPALAATGYDATVGMNLLAFASLFLASGLGLLALRKFLSRK